MMGRYRDRFVQYLVNHTDIAKRFNIIRVFLNGRLIIFQGFVKLTIFRMNHTKIEIRSDVIGMIMQSFMIPITNITKQKSKGLTKAVKSRSVKEVAIWTNRYCTSVRFAKMERVRGLKISHLFACNSRCFETREESINVQVDLLYVSQESKQNGQS